MTTDNSKKEFDNGFGGFVEDGREYEIIMDEEIRPPAPWINVISNRLFGFSVSETGAGSTWAYNSRENKITPWSNDPVCDQASEAIYIVNKETDRIITPTSLGRKDRGGYRVRHGFGYSKFYHKEDGLSQQLTVFTPVAEPMKIWKLLLKNNSDRELSLSIVYYLEWVLGADRNHTNSYIVSSFNNDLEYLSAKNVYSYDYRKYQAFMFSSEIITGYTGNRHEVLGSGGSVKYPLGLTEKLSCTTGSGLDSCGAIQTLVTLKPGEHKEISFCLGYSDSEDEMYFLCNKYKSIELLSQEYGKVLKYWERTLGEVEIRTRDRAMDILVNGWLLYQTISCRIFARAAFYQCGGAYGFRDQLQDGLSLLHCYPDMLKELILNASQRQFLEGDVQHWWHPPTGVGVRTKITDDLLWLPYVTAEYIAGTGDYNILAEKTPYIEGPMLEADQYDMMFVPEVSETIDSVYEHCKKAIQHVGFGEHGLPLMGGGDWNDGMDKVGIEGTGESVWLGWFFYTVLDNFIPLCKHVDDLDFAAKLDNMKNNLKESINREAWDGEWYLRAFYDDGTKIGSKDNDECRIDSISQSWSIISRAAPKERAVKAFASAWEHLVIEQDAVSLLLTPPFNKTDKDPGYIKKYYPGIRENGGQYTHGAIWLSIAATLLRDDRKAYKLFSMLNPINNTTNYGDALRYEKEPYVMTADISYMAPYTGRGGWSWYTGSSGWMYKGILEHFLGIKKQSDHLLINPCVPEAFGDFKIKYRYKSSSYLIEVRHCNREELIADRNLIKLEDDGREHHIIVEI